MTSELKGYPDFHIGWLIALCSINKQTYISPMYDGGQDALRKKVMVFTDVTYIHRQLSARLQCLQCVSNGDIAVLHEAIDMGIAEVNMYLKQNAICSNSRNIKYNLVQNILEFILRVPFFRKLQSKTTLRHKWWCVDCLSIAVYFVGLHDRQMDVVKSFLIHPAFM